MAFLQSIFSIVKKLDGQGAVERGLMRWARGGCGDFREFNRFALGMLFAHAMSTVGPFVVDAAAVVVCRSCDAKPVYSVSTCDPCSERL